MITHMAKMEVVGPKKHLLSTIDAIHDYGKLHISSTRFTDLPEFAKVEKPELDPEQIRYQARLDELLKKVDDILALLSETPGIYKNNSGLKVAEAVSPADLSEDVLEERFSMSEELGQKIRGLVKKRMDLKDELSFVNKYQRVVKAFVPMIEKLEHIKKLELIGFTMKKKKKEVLDVLRQELKAITEDHFEIFTRELDENTLAGIVAMPRDYMRPVKRLFISERISELRLPESMGDRSPMETLRSLHDRIQDIPKEIETIDEEIKSLSTENYPDIFEKLHSAVEDRLSELQAMSQVGQTKRTFILTAWLPEKFKDEFMDYAQKKFDPSIVVTPGVVNEEDLKSDQIPVIIENPPFLRPFELCLKLIPQPKYSSIDPTPFLALFFPIIFGLILGDMAYGIVIVALSAFVHFKFRKYYLAHCVSVIMFACGTSTIFFGFLFGEFLGDLGHGLLHPILMNREKAIIPTLVLAVSVGVAHVFLGIILKAYNSIKWKHYGHAVEALSTMFLIIAISVLIAALGGQLPDIFKQASIVAIIILIPTLIASGGVIALLEIFGVFGNILSYARIMAIGLSSVILAVVANKIAGGFGNIVAGVIIASMIHLINLILGMFGPTVHGLRLHYVEFFSKFYKTGAPDYKPLTRKSQTPVSAQKGGK